MGFVNKATTAVQTAAAVAGSGTGQPTASVQLAKQQYVRTQQRQSTSLSSATRTSGRPTTSAKKQHDQQPTRPK